MIDSGYTFSDAIHSSGLEPPEVIVPGKLHRFPGIGKHNSNRAGWCLLFEDGRGGSFGDWSSGFTENWQEKHRKSFSKVERAAFRRKVAAARETADLERKRQQDLAAIRAQKIWGQAVAAPVDHPYLIRKGVQPHGVQLYFDALLLPVMRLGGEIRSLQFIAEDGGKRLLTHGQKQGCMIPVNGLLSTEMKSPLRIVICEGWATGATLAEDSPDALVLAAIDAGNLKTVALQVRNCWPGVELIIAGDDDRLTAGNPGVSKATEAAIAANAKLLLPQWPLEAPQSLTDFNDLACWLHTAKGVHHDR